MTSCLLFLLDMYQIAIVTTRISSPAKGKIIGAPAMAKVMAMTKIGNETKNKNNKYLPKTKNYLGKALFENCY